MFPTEESCRQFLAEMRLESPARRCSGGKNNLCAEVRVFTGFVKTLPRLWRAKRLTASSVIHVGIFQEQRFRSSCGSRVVHLMLDSQELSALHVHRVIFGEDSGVCLDYHTTLHVSPFPCGHAGPDALVLTGEVEVVAPAFVFQSATSTSPFFVRRSRELREEGLLSSGLPQGSVSPRSLRTVDTSYSERFCEWSTVSASLPGRHRRACRLPFAHQAGLSL